MIADVADQDAADRPHEIADGKYSERREQLGEWALVGEKLAADLDSEEAVDGEVVPFEHVADHARADGSAAHWFKHLAGWPPSLREPAARRSKVRNRLNAFHLRKRQTARDTCKRRAATVIPRFLSALPKQSRSEK